MKETVERLNSEMERRVSALNSQIRAGDEQRTGLQQEINQLQQERIM